MFFIYLPVAVTSLRWLPGKCSEPKSVEIQCGHLKALEVLVGAFYYHCLQPLCQTKLSWLKVNLYQIYIIKIFIYVFTQHSTICNNLMIMIQKTCCCSYCRDFVFLLLILYINGPKVLCQLAIQLDEAA